MERDASVLRCLGYPVSSAGVPDALGGVVLAKCRAQLPAVGCEHRAWFPSRPWCSRLPSPSEKHFCLHLRTSGFQAFLNKAPSEINEELLFVAAGQQGSAHSPGRCRCQDPSALSPPGLRR